MVGKQSKRRGFTLPEVIVTITLIAALAAVVVPAVANQIKKGDPNRVASDGQAIRGAVEQFLTDVRRYPRSMGQLTNQIKTTDAALTLTSPGTISYLIGDSTRWKGAYLTKDSLAALVTGFGWTFVSAFSVDSLAITGVSSVATGSRYLVLKALIAGGKGTASADALLFDQTYDDGDLNGGSIRWRAGNGSTSPDTVKIILMPMS